MIELRSCSIARLLGDFGRRNQDIPDADSNPFVLFSVMDELIFFSSLDEAFLFSSLFIVPLIWLLLRIKWWYASHGVSRPSFLRLGFLLVLAFAVSLIPL
jgi:hypothetical protein